MKRVKLISKIIICCFVLLSCKQQQPNNKVEANAKDVMKKNFWDNLPKASDYTNDFENILTPQQEDTLNNLIHQYQQKTTHQIAIITLDTTACIKESFDSLALSIFNTWGVGNKEKNNGITITISKGYRRVRICNGIGIEKILSNTETKEILNNNFINHFKNNNYYLGLKEGTIALMNKVEEKMKTLETKNFKSI